VVLTLLVRPFLATQHPAPLVETATLGGPRDVRRQLLRQVRDLDEDLAAGKLSKADHGRLRRTLEEQLAPLLRVDADLVRNAAPPTDLRPVSRTGRTRRSRLWRAVSAVAAIGTVVAAGVVLAGAVQERPQPATPATADAAPVATGPAGSFGTEPTQEQLAAVKQAVREVRSHPGSVTAHLRLAHAYTAVGQPQLATVEYLATTRIDAGNAEANTALGLVAFTSGNAPAAKEMVDRALTTRPGYPEALYVRGLVLAMGLKRPVAAAKSFHAYLDVAPFGSHRSTVETLLAMVEGDR
jgi:Tfp pilus assembly protein PilF